VENSPKTIFEARPLTAEEHHLVQWLLEHGESNAASFLSQLARARVVARCECGCASVDFEVEGQPQPSGGLRILSDFVWGGRDDLCGVFVFERSGVLAGLEVYGLAGEVPAALPDPSVLRPFHDEAAQ
jgi:hypothetical protein